MEIDTKDLMIKNTLTRVSVYDSAGEENFRSIVRSYFRRADGFILVYSIDDAQSFDNVSKYIKDLMASEAKDPIIFLVGNKKDRIENRVVSFDQGKALADCYGMKFIETSAKTSENIQEMLDMSFREIKIRAQNVKNVDNLKTKNELLVLLDKKDNKEKPRRCIT